jgi:hypothetical protein
MEKDKIRKAKVKMDFTDSFIVIRGMNENKSCLKP